MIEHTPGITRLLDRLEEAGRVDRHRCTEYRRRVWARIPVAHAVAALSDAKKRQLVRITGKLRADGSTNPTAPEARNTCKC